MGIVDTNKGAATAEESTQTRAEFRIVPWIVALLPMLCASLIMAILTGILQYFFDCSATPCASGVDTIVKSIPPTAGSLKIPSELAHEGGFISWAIWSLLYTFVLATATVISIVVLSKELWQNRGRIRELVVGVVALLGVLSLMIYWIFGRPDVHTLTVDPFIRIIDGNKAHASWTVAYWLNWFKFGTYVVSGWLVVVGVIVLNTAINTTGRVKSASTKETFLHELSKRQQHIQLLLYSGALLLAVGVVHIQTIHAWALSYLTSDKDVLVAGVAFTSTLTTYAGLSASALLAATYLPASAIVAELAQKHTSDQKLLEKYGLNFSLQGFLIRAATILAPLLTVPVSGVFTQILGTGN